MWLFKKQPKPEPNDGRKEKIEAIENKRSLSEHIMKKMESLDRRFHSEPVILERRRA